MTGVADVSYAPCDDTLVPCEKASHPVTSQPLLFIFSLPFHSPALTMARELANVSARVAESKAEFRSTPSESVPRNNFRIFNCERIQFLK